MYSSNKVRSLIVLACARTIMFQLILFLFLAVFSFTKVFDVDTTYVKQEALIDCVNSRNSYAFRDNIDFEENFDKPDNCKSNKNYN